jgi:DNA-directed RNA polymerase subunit RPC12/RpoP
MPRKRQTTEIYVCDFCGAETETYQAFHELMIVTGLAGSQLKHVTVYVCGECVTRPMSELLTLLGRMPHDAENEPGEVG